MSYAINLSKNIKLGLDIKIVPMTLNNSKTHHLYNRLYGGGGVGVGGCGREYGWRLDVAVCGGGRLGSGVCERGWV